jgi:DNA-directed RNA polymerase specialized sigma24 family protein
MIFIERPVADADLCAAKLAMRPRRGVTVGGEAARQAPDEILVRHPVRLGGMRAGWRIPMTGIEGLREWRRALALLSDGEREAGRVCAVEGLGHVAAAERLIAIAALETRLADALIRLERILSGSDDVRAVCNAVGAV